MGCRCGAAHPITLIASQNEILEAIFDFTARPDWDGLMTRVSRHPRCEHADDDSNYHAVEAVEQYKHFLQLKLDGREWASLSLSPSDELDLVWHLHLLLTIRRLPMRLHAAVRRPCD